MIGLSDAPDLDAAVMQSLERIRSFIDARLSSVLTLSSEASPRLFDAMRYALLAPGKRLRPALVLWAASACSKEGEAAVERAWEAATPAALAAGRPTCHRQFDEATAILCGDALQALAFETLAEGLPAATAGRGCLVLARASGGEALVGGQADDLAAERGWVSDMATAPAAERVAWLERIHRRKTGALFSASLELGGLSVAASQEQHAMLAAFGRAFGLAFQIADDILDAEGTEEAVGKRVGKDVERGKLTFPSVIGLEASRERGNALAREAVEAVGGMGKAADDLARLAHWIVRRNH
jgi:geranylgeranyl diphosphate synthase type II